MTKTMTSMAEIIRVGGWGLRGLGYPYGVAERAVPLVAWTEAAQGGAMRSLLDAEPEIAKSLTAPAIGVTVLANGVKRLDAHGRHLIEVGPPAIDLLTVEARRGEKGDLQLVGWIGDKFVPALGSLLGKRKLTGIMGYSAEVGEDTRWVLFSEELVTVLGSSDASPRRAESLLAATGLGGDEIERIISAHEGNRPASSYGYMTMTAWKSGALDQGASQDNLVARVDTAWRDGFETELDDIKYLYQLETRAWAPTSERSRSQAGYGKF
ncbi:hypothetical protein [Bosea sp. NBC_00550]|uniref:hypothetical protein n=1 Tax=Bosea sp. NBC_00550 TaxID=2969621 RepID=UPI0022315187|nr:hypothetical protein [Bosea sp. NBC_00550]UZF95554.1 hypothetical protein NWE53_29215 [Bosea sp. NBC_00550]